VERRALMEDKTLNVLVVEDNPSWQEIFREILESKKHIVKVAGSRNKAVALLHDNCFDLAIVDVRLDDCDESNIDGVKVLEELASLGVSTKAVITTGYREQIGTYKDVFARCSVFDYFGKGDERWERKLLSIEERIVASRGELGLGEIEGQPISFETHQTLHQMLDQYVKRTGAGLGQLLLDRGDNTLVVRVSTRDEEEGVFIVDVNDSISGLAFRMGKPFRIPDVTAPKWGLRYKTQAEKEKLRSELAVPMRHGEKIIGVLNVESTEVGAFDERDEQMMVTFAEQSVMAIRNGRLLQGVRALQEISGEMLRQPIDQERIWALILERGLELVGGRYGNVTWVEGEELIEVMAKTGEARARRPESPQRIRIDDSITGWVVRKKEPTFVEDVRTQEPYKTLYKEVWPGMRSQLTVPIIVHDRAVGALNVESSRVSAFGQDEMALLQALADQAAMTIFNVRPEYEQAQAREKMIAMGALSGRLAHDLNSPLSSIKNRIRLLEITCDKDLDTIPDLRKGLEEISRNTRETIQLVNEMRERARQAKAVPMSVVEPIQQALHMAQAKWPSDRQIELDAQYQNTTDLPPVAGMSLLVYVFYDLITNALEAMPQGGRLAIGVEHLPDHKVVQVTVSDTGYGIPEPLLEEIFKPYFTSKGNGDLDRGHGMGLYWSQIYVKCLGGSIIPRSVVGQGTDMIVQLPVWEG
jgi:signal transduction histidine kinase/ActR/RegA family two-component response regulator